MDNYELQPRVDFREEERIDDDSEEVSIAIYGDGKEADIESLITLYNEDPALLSDEEINLLPVELFEQPLLPEDHKANLAEFLDEEVLTRIASDVIGWVDEDKESRAKWQDRISRGMKFLGVTEETIGGAGDDFSKVVHPGVQEARVQFQARAIAEVWQASGPVKCQVLGNANEERNAQARRVQTYLNYLYMHKIPGAYEEEESMLYGLPIFGSAFKKVWYDPILKQPSVAYIRPDRFHVPSDATDLQTSPHYTEEFYETGNETLIKMRHGIYRKVNLDEPNVSAIEREKIETTINEAEGVEHPGYDGDQSYKRYECYANLNLPGFEDVDENGEETGIALPYIITVDEDNETVLSIYRGWNQDDDLKLRRVFHIHYKFLPGDDFYGHGLIHSIGGLSEAATGALRALLDAAMLSNLQGGWTSQEVDLEGGKMEFKMGKFRKTRATAEELRNGIFSLPFKEPSNTLFALLGFCTDQMQRFASTTEVMVGDAANSAPVGTTLAQIEQGSKVFSGIHKRLHQAHMQEYKLVAKIVGDNPPIEGYPYEDDQEIRNLIITDFDDRIDVVPVSDPNIISQSQRIALAQATLQLASQFPEHHDMKKVVRDVHIALGNVNLDELMPPPQEAQPVDPVSEVGAILTGQPVQAAPDQNHQAHIDFLQRWFTTLTPEIQGQIQPQYQAILFQHMAMLVKQMVEKQTGMPAEQVPPELLAQIPLESGQTGPSQEDVAFQMEQERQDALAMNKMNLDSQKVLGDIQRKDAKVMSDIELQAMAATGEEQRKAMMNEAKILSDAQVGIENSQREAMMVKENLRGIENE